MNTKQQGDVGVAMAIAYFTNQGYVVSVPLTDNAKYDLIVESNGVYKTVQCKSTSFKDGSYYKVELRTKGGNTSWSGEVGRVVADLLFVYSFDGNGYLFESEDFDGKGSLSLGQLRKGNIVFHTQFPK
jgi:hypothetical protein